MNKPYVLATSLVFCCCLGAVVTADGPADDATQELQRLRAEVSTLRRQVDYLMIHFRYSEDDIDALTQRVRHAEKVQARVQALFQVGGAQGSADQLHRCNAELRLAQARLAFAKQDYDAAMEHMDAAVAASKMVVEVLENRLAAGTVILDFLIAAQESVTNIMLERNRMRRSIQVLQTQK